MIIFVAAAELTHKDQRSSEQHCIGRFLEVEENIDAQQAGPDGFLTSGRVGSSICQKVRVPGRVRTGSEGSQGIKV